MKQPWTNCVSVLIASAMIFMIWMPTTAEESTPSASKQPNRAIAFYPEETGPGTFITVEINPGESKTVNIVIGNSGEIDQTIRTYAVPAMSATNGGFNLKDYGSEQDEVTSWVDYPEAVLTLSPTEGLSSPVTISVPENAKPGEYVTGLAAQQAEPFEVPGTQMVIQVVRWSIPILIVVPGDRNPDFELGDATLENRNGIYIAEIGISNTGNVIVRPSGEVRLLDGEGTVIGVSTVTLDSVYTGTATTFIVGWEDIPPGESYSLQIVLTAEEGTVTVEQEIMGLVPFSQSGDATPVPAPLTISSSEMIPLTSDIPPSTLLFDAEISNSGEPIENARVSIVTYQDGIEVDRYPIMQAVTIEQGTTPVEARYSLPGGFTEGTYTFEVTIEVGDAGTQTVLVTQPIDFEVVVGD